MNITKLVEIAKFEAEKSTHQHRMGCVIFHKNRIISTGYNYPQRSVKHLRRKFFRWYGSVHAEIDAIIKARTDLTRASMLVVRINRKGDLKLAKPCSHCSAYIDHVGIRKVYYSTNEGKIENE